eukprot:363751-Chlamydomonas_euryale.AAC.3
MLSLPALPPVDAHAATLNALTPSLAPRGRACGCAGRHPLPSLRQQLEPAAAFSPVVHQLQRHAGEYSYIVSSPPLPAHLVLPPFPVHLNLPFLPRPACPPPPHVHLVSPHTPVHL